MRGSKMAYWGLGVMHFFIMLYYITIFALATVGLALHQVMLGTIHFFVLLGIAISQLFAKGSCPLTKLQNLFAQKMGKRPIESFISNLLKTICGWQPRRRNVRRATVSATFMIIAYYMLVHFALF